MSLVFKIYDNRAHSLSILTTVAHPPITSANDIQQIWPSDHVCARDAAADCCYECVPLSAPEHWRRRAVYRRGVCDIRAVHVRGRDRVLPVGGMPFLAHGGARQALACAAA